MDGGNKNVIVSQSKLPHRARTGSCVVGAEPPQFNGATTERQSADSDNQPTGAQWLIEDGIHQSGGHALARFLILQVDSMDPHRFNLAITGFDDLDFRVANR